ncbi:MAG: universal stress protein [Actinomycetota bacterium]
MLERIIVTSDGSERAGRAVSFAYELASKFGSKLAIVFVRVPDASVPRSALETQASKSGAEIVVIDDERPAEAICEFARSSNADAIVLGNYGMSDRKQFLLGNVPNRVSHHAQCSVIIVDTRDEKERKRHRSK